MKNFTMSTKHFKDLKKEIMHHECFLAAEEPPVICFINSGYCVYFRRFIRNTLLVSERNPRCSKVFHSKASIRREMERHLQYHYNVIHPFSDLKYGWEIFLTYLTCISLFVYPLLSYADESNLIYFVYAKLGLDCVYVIDIIMTFNCGYLNNNTNRVHLSRTQAAVQYLKTWFLLDLMCTINMDLFFLDYNHIFYLKLCNFIRVLRVASALKYLNIYRQVHKFSLYKFNFFKIVLLMWILLLWLTSFLYLMSMKFEEKWMIQSSQAEKIISCLYRVAYLFFLIGYGEGYSTHNYTMIFEMTCWMIGIILRMFVIGTNAKTSKEASFLASLVNVLSPLATIIGKVLNIAEIVQIVNKYNAASNKYYQRIQRLRDFMGNKGLPTVTCNRILQYFDFRFQKTFYKEDQILSTLSSQLQKEIIYQTCKRLLQNVTIFKDLPTAIVLKLVACLKSVIFLPNDLIVQAGTTGEHMYFIHNGTVAVYTAVGIEVCHLTDGSNFGEVSMVMKDEKRIATVVAVDSCELYILSRADFEKVISPYPDLYNRMYKIAEDRFMKTMARESSIFSKSKSETIVNINY